MIVVIAILAAITVVAYNGVQQRAKTAAITSAVSQWKNVITIELTANPDAKVQGCLGASNGDFPAEGNFPAGECVLDYENGTLAASVSYADANYSNWSTSTTRPNGKLPKTTMVLNSGSSKLEARGIWASDSGSTVQLLWVPQIDGECGQGVVVAHNSTGDSTGGGYCGLVISR